jgi:enoyl-CoA hydratase
MADSVLRHTHERSAHLLVMDHGANALDLELLDALVETMASLKDDGGPPLVLASSHPTVFSPGWDLKRLAVADRHQVAAVLSRFNAAVLALFSYPGPTAAAIAGHAVAGGCQLALACDLRIMATGRPRLGLAELNLGVPVPTGSLGMLRARVGPAVVEDLVLRGEGYDARRARELSLVQRVVSPTEVIGTAQRELGQLASKPRSAFAATKAALYSDTWSKMQQTRSEDEKTFLECWFEPETRERISEVVRGLGQE